jgi:pimeloyl-ACP methyl ester carboxylesterase
LAYAHEAAKGAPLIIWGSSYSASLAFRAAADHADKIDAVVAMSTATGGALDKCGAKIGLPNLADPALAVWPKSEEGQAKGLADLLSAQSVEVQIVPNGVHGSSMLVDERTKHDMSEARAKVAAWLAKTIK